MGENQLGFSPQVPAVIKRRELRERENVRRTLNPRLHNKIINCLLKPPRGKLYRRSSAATTTPFQPTRTNQPLSLLSIYKSNRFIRRIFPLGRRARPQRVSNAIDSVHGKKFNVVKVHSYIAHLECFLIRVAARMGSFNNLMQVKIFNHEGVFHL
jgi:hypothetical protein